MSREENKSLARRFIEEVYQKGNLDFVDEIIPEDMLEHEEMGGAPGREGVKEAVRMFRSAFPDLSVTIEDELAEGDTVFLRTTWNGTHEGEFMGIKPTGMHVNFGSMDEIRFQDGKLVEHWGISDTMGLMIQLGAVALPFES